MTLKHHHTENMSKENSSIVRSAATKGYYDILLFLIENGYSIDTKITAVMAKKKAMINVTNYWLKMVVNHSILANRYFGAMNGMALIVKDGNA
jgi:hypothetical protein